MSGSDSRRDRISAIVEFLSIYTHILDSYIIEFFTESLWEEVPVSWRDTLSELSPPQLSQQLLDGTRTSSYQSVWPLSLLAFRATAHALGLPRRSQGGRDTERHELRGQREPLQQAFYLHVKPKKQHEIHRMGMLVRTLCNETGCRNVIDVGSGKGHLSRYLAFGQDLRVTGVEAGEDLVGAASRFDGQLARTLAKETARAERAGALAEGCLPGASLPRHVAGWVDPGAPWEDFARLVGEPGHPGVADADRGFVLTGLHSCGDLSAAVLKLFAQCPEARAVTSVACCYMKLSTREQPSPEGTGRGHGAPARPPGYPISRYLTGKAGHRLSYKARELACHSLDAYARRLTAGGEELRAHCYRAALEAIIREREPSLRRTGIQAIGKAHKVSFHEYARRGLQKVGLDPEAGWDATRAEGMLARQPQVLAYFSLCLLLAPVVESLILLDRAVYLQEQGFQAELSALFDARLSPRNFVLVAMKRRVATEATEALD